MIMIVKNLYNLLYNKYYAEGTFAEGTFAEGTFGGGGGGGGGGVSVSISNDEEHDEFMIDGLELILLKVIKL
jgi:hypothetical protein